MPSLRLAAALALLLLASAPAALAAAADGHLEVAGPAALGATAWSAPVASLRFEGVPELTADAEGLVVTRTGYRSLANGGPLSGLVTGAEGFEETTEHGASTLRIEPTGPAPRVALHAEGGATLRVPSAQLSPVEGVRVFTGDEGLNWYDCAETRHCLRAAGVHELAAQTAQGDFAGSALLYLYDVALVVEEGGTSTRYESGTTQREGAQGLQREDTHLRVELLGAQGALQHDGPLAAYAAAPELRTDTLVLTAATGAVDVGARSHRAAGDRVDARGDILLTPLPVAAGAWDSGGEPAYAPSFETRVQGDITHINLDAVPVFADTPAQQAGLLALAAGVAAAGAYFWPLVQFHGTAVLAPLYTRLQPPKLLDNDVRNAIFEIIRQNPGISARGIHRKSEQSWGTVVYHLRQLESHHLVVSRRFGRSRNFYENHGKYRGMEKQLAVLRSPRAQALAALVLAHPGLTQEELAQQALLAQPTTSYYVRKLVGAELVAEEREGRYVRYRPTPELARYLEISRQPELASSGPTPAQA